MGDGAGGAAVTDDLVRITLAGAEIRQLRMLLDEFVALLREPDEGFARSLAPSAYPDDQDADAAFRAATAGDLRRRREQDADRVLDDLIAAGGPGRWGTRTIDIDPDGANAWMRTLAAVRLALATRLVAGAEERPAPNDDGRAVYEWLGYRLDTLMRALDAR